MTTAEFRAWHEAMGYTYGTGAAALGGRRSLGRALLNERCMAKPETPLTRLWLEKLALPAQARA